MALLLIETLDDQATASLLDNPHIRLVGEVNQHITPPKKVVKRKWAGSISPETAKMLQEEVTRMRAEEWDRDF